MEPCQELDGVDVLSVHTSQHASRLKKLKSD